MLCWLRFLPQNPIISRSDGDAQHPRERVPGQCKWPSVWRNFPRLRSLPWVGGVWDPWCVWLQTTLTIFIAGKCKGSNETLPLLLHPRWERSRGHLSALPVVIPRGPPASPFLLHYKIPPREGASFSFNLVIGKKNKMEDLESAVIIVFIPLWKVCCPLSMNNPKAKWFYLYFSCTPLPFPPPGCAVIIEQLYHWDYWC